LPAPSTSRDFPQAHSTAFTRTLLWHNVGQQPSG
jgi:hypothetical protein